MSRIDNFKYVIHIVYLHGSIYQVFDKRQDALESFNQLKNQFNELDGLQLIEDIKVY